MRPIFVLPLLLAVSLVHAVPSVSGAKDTSGASYLALESFVVNLKDGPRVRFMQVKMQLMASNPKVQEAIMMHMPAVRDQLIMLFAHQDAVVLRSPEGRDALRQDALAAVQAVVNEMITTTDETTGVEAVYFTDFVIQ